MDLEYDEIGEKNKESILFLHGAGLGSWIWKNQCLKLTDFHCVVIDLPGHGKNQANPFQLQTASEKILELIKEHGKTTHVVGLSLGGQIALEMLNNSPEVLGNVIITGVPIRTPEKTDNFEKLVEYVLQEYASQKNRDFLIKAYIRNYNISKDYFELLKSSTTIIPPEEIKRIFKANMLFEIPPHLNKVDNPVLVLGGEKEYGIIKSSIKSLVKTIPHSKGYIVPEMVHMWNLTSPDYFNLIIKNWIAARKLPEDLIPVE